MNLRRAARNYVSVTGDRRSATTTIASGLWFAAARTVGSMMKPPRRVLPILLAQAILTLALSLAPVIGKSARADALYPLCALLLALFAWSLYTARLVFGSLFEPYALFLVSAFMFNAGQPMLEALGLTPWIGMLSGRFSSALLSETAYLILVCLSWMHTGALLAAFAWPLDVDAPVRARATAYARLRRVGWILFAVSIVPTIYVTGQAITAVVRYGTMGLYQTQGLVGFQAIPGLLAQFTVPAGLLLLAGSERRPLPLRTSAVIFGLYVASQFYLGVRSTASMPLMAFAWLWSRTIRPIRGRLIVAGALALVLVVFPLIRMARGLTDRERTEAAVVAATYSQVDNPATDAINEFGGTMAAVAHTIALVPSERQHGNGEGYAYALLTIVPNFFWDIHPTVARGILAKWLVERVEPLTAAQGGGLGYSCIAEAYEELGWYGAPLAMALLGFGFASASSWARRSGNPAKLAAVAGGIAFLLRFPRDESASMVRVIVWYIAVPYVFTVTRGSPRRRADAS